MKIIALRLALAFSIAGAVALAVLLPIQTQATHLRYPFSKGRIYHSSFDALHSPGSQDDSFQVEPLAGANQTALGHTNLVRMAALRADDSPLATPTITLTITATLTPTLTSTPAPAEAAPTDTPEQRQTSPLATPTETPTEMPTPSPTFTVTPALPTTESTATLEVTPTVLATVTGTPAPDAPPTDDTGSGLEQELPATGANLATTRAADPEDFPTALPFRVPQPYTMEEAVGSTFSFSLDHPYRLELPAIEVDTDVIPVGWQEAKRDDGSSFMQWDVAEEAAGWHNTSALPGEIGNLVISGHNNIGGAVFRDLYRVAEGDEVVVWLGNRGFVYRVTQVMLLPEDHVDLRQRELNARWIGPFDDRRLTLVSCWPDDGNSHRVVVVADLATE